MRKTALSLYFLTIFIYSFAQQGNNWYFGQYAGVTFNTSPPSALTNGSLITDEGSTAISDRNGNLLFYTDGVTVYNRNHLTMPNGTGLMGNTSSTNSAIIVPKPGDTTTYFIFTSDAAENGFTVGYRYSEVNMTLNGGLGDIINKNILLYSPSTERLTATRHANGIDYWVFTKEWGNNRFKVFKVDCNGVNPNPVISDVGVSHLSPTDFYYAGIGAMKASPDGTKVCVALRGGPNCGAELFDFDNITGILSNPVFLTGYDPVLMNVFGVEFSPDSKVLYISAGNPGGINQYNISSGNAAIINASKINIASPYWHYSMQLGPDGKIYLNDYFNSHLSVIDNPNNYGPGLIFSPGTFSLNGGYCIKGLVSMLTTNNNFAPQVDFTYSFVNCYVQFTGSANVPGNILKWYWDFGDNKIDSGQTVIHSYRNSGNYNVRLAVYLTGACGVIDSFIIIKPVTINNVFSVDFDHTGSCVNQGYQFIDSTKLTVGNITGWNWEFGDGSSSTLQNPLHIYATPGAYPVKFVVSTSGICRADSIIKTVYVDTKPTADFIFNNGCINQGIPFADASSNAFGNINKWSWDFGDGNTDTTRNPFHLYSSGGNYNVNLAVSSLHGCSASISKSVIIEDKPIADFSFTEPCLSQLINFTDNSTIGFGNITNWQWMFGDNSASAFQNPGHTYIQEGDYNVTLIASSEYGCVSDPQTAILNIRKVNANAGGDTIAIYDQPLQLQASGGISYQWTPATSLDNSNIANPVARLKNDISYILKVTTQQGCIGYDTINIKVYNKFDIYVPTGFTPNNDGKNDFLKAIGVGIRKMEYFRIYNRWGQEIFSTTELNKGWDGKIKGIQQPAGIYVWMVKGIDIFGKLITKKGTSSLIR